MIKKFRILFLCAVCLLAGCQKGEENQIDLLPADQERYYYAGTEEADRLAVDENGLLYTMEFIAPEYTGPVVMGEGNELAKYYKKISVFDLEGNCIKSELVEAGNGIWSNMVLRDEVLYCVMDKSEWDYGKAALFAIDTRDWTVTMVKQLPEYKEMGYISIIGDYLYLLGETVDERLDEEEKSALDSFAYPLRNKKIIRLKLTEENPVTEQMSIDFPCALYCTEQNTLMLYRYSPEKGYGFLEFNPEQVTLTEPKWSKTDFVPNKLSGCGNGFLYYKFNDNVTKTLLYYGTMDGLEAQVLPDDVVLQSPAVYQKGFVFFINANGEKGVERVCLENILQKDKTLRVLKLDDNQETPFECGFLTESMELDSEKFALKVLARDADFDLFLLNSRESISHNIKENGAFYALNQVEGVQEYIEACFPYIKELATDEEGNIWMLPVVPAVYGLVYNQEFCKANQVNFADMNWNEFVDFTAEAREEKEELLSVSMHLLTEQFLAQYLSKYDTFDTEEFRNCAGQLREIIQKYGNWGITLTIDNGIEMNQQVPDFYYRYIISTGNIERYYSKLKEASEQLGVIGLPSISAEIGNVGTIAFLAVNPESDNLETALEYVSAFAKYMVTKQDSFILEDENMYTDTPFMKEAYELYANAEVYFMMDADVYWKDFQKYLSGELELEEMIVEIERKYKLYMGE